jgi:AcrR family transcriptional regulator
VGNREDTKERILAAGLLLLAAEGFAALGVNSLARKSGADKQLIYRYFGGLDGVLAALGEKVAQDMTEALHNALPEPSEQPQGSYGQIAQQMLLALLQHLRADAAYRQLRLMEVTAPGALTEAFAQARGQVLGDWVRSRTAGVPLPEGRDVPAINALLIAAVEGMVILGAVGLSGDVLDRQEAALNALISAAYP